ncbi:MAG: ImmA/IrrE family metallo-endopeptidase [Pseudomonadota bacterium]
MSIRRPRYTKINAEVDRLLALARVKRAPVPVEKVAELVGADVVYNNFNNEVSGVLIRKNGKPLIGVASEQSKERQRFTIAHELGHFLLHEGEEVHVDKVFKVNFRSPMSSAAVDVEEIEANAFAASLLMPVTFLRSDLKGVLFDIENDAQVELLAKKYGVSTQAMGYRLMNVFSSERRS